MRLWIYDDPLRKWGRALLAEALERQREYRSIDARLFRDPAEPDHGVVFGRLHHYEPERSRCKAAWEAMARRPELRLCPDARSARLYDDKLEQARRLHKWMPGTLILRGPDAVHMAVDQIGLPLISKSREGAGSHNVRLIRTTAEARREAELAFKGGGIPLHRAAPQRGYLLWQRFLPGNAYDFRVIRIGRERLILRRGNRADRPMASGSSDERPVTWPDAEAQAVLDFANEFFEAEAMRFCGVDVVWDRDSGLPRILECTTGWPLGNMPAHRFVSGRSCADFWPVVMNELEAGELC